MAQSQSRPKKGTKGDNLPDITTLVEMNWQVGNQPQFRKYETEPLHKIVGENLGTSLKTTLHDVVKVEEGKPQDPKVVALEAKITGITTKLDEGIKSIYQNAMQGEGYDKTQVEQEFKTAKEAISEAVKAAELTPKAQGELVTNLNKSLESAQKQSEQATGEIQNSLMIQYQNKRVNDIHNDTIQHYQSPAKGQSFTYWQLDRPLTEEEKNRIAQAKDQNNKDKQMLGDAGELAGLRLESSERDNKGLEEFRGMESGIYSRMEHIEKKDKNGDVLKDAKGQPLYENKPVPYKFYYDADDGSVEPILGKGQTFSEVFPEVLQFLQAKHPTSKKFEITYRQNAETFVVGGHNKFSASFVVSNVNDAIKMINQGMERGVMITLPKEQMKQLAQSAVDNPKVRKAYDQLIKTLGVAEEKIYGEPKRLVEQAHEQIKENKQYGFGNEQIAKIASERSKELHEVKELSPKEIKEHANYESKQFKVGDQGAFEAIQQIQKITQRLSSIGEELKQNQATLKIVEEQQKRVKVDGSPESIATLDSHFAIIGKITDNISALEKEKTVWEGEARNFNTPSKAELKEDKDNFILYAEKVDPKFKVAREELREQYKQSSILLQDVKNKLNPADQTKDLTAKANSLHEKNKQKIAEREVKQPQNK